jgi:hypothetical protein
MDEQIMPLFEIHGFVLICNALQLSVFLLCVYFQPISIKLTMPLSQTSFTVHQNRYKMPFYKSFYCGGSVVPMKHLCNVR